MIAITVIVNIFIFSNINCQQLPQGSGLNPSLQETYQRFPLPYTSSEPFAYDYDTYTPSRYQDFFGSSVSSQFPFRELSNWPGSSQIPFNLEDFAANFKRVSGFRPQSLAAMETGFGNHLLEASNIQRLTGQSYQLSGQIPRSFRSTIESSQTLETPESLSPATSFNIPELTGFEPIPSLGFQKPEFLPQVPPISPPCNTGFTVPTVPPASTPSFKAPRSIPSPLAYIDSTPFQNSCDDPFSNTFDSPSSILTSSVGCLQLTVTPYGTISETPLPDPSIPLPRGPFLPIASPVSAFAPPLSPLLPSASPAGRGTTFLRKVPVPPPFI